MSVDLLTKEGRQKCWDSKDSYWQCLDSNGGEQANCTKQRKQFENDCSKTWVKYFDRRKGFLKLKSDLETGKMDVVDELTKNK